MTKTIVAITGASSGIGAAFARRLAPGHDLLLIARRKDKLEQLASELRAAHGSDVEIRVADLANANDLASLESRLQEEPRLALLINNAGFGTKGRFWEIPLEGQDQMHRLHVLAAMRLTHAALGNMVRRDFGGIINVASVAAFVRTGGSASYCATKSWMTAFTEGLYLELKNARSNVTMQALCPGYTYSEFHDVLAIDRRKTAPAAFWLTAEEVVEASLQGMRRRKLFVIPGWRYRVLIALVSKLPAGLRLAVEGISLQSRDRQQLPGGHPGSLQ